MMLRKIKVGGLVGAGLQMLQVFFPDMEIPEDAGPVIEGLISAAVVAIPVFAAWLTPESQANIEKLDTKDFLSP